MSYTKTTIISLLLLTLTSGCATVGMDFPAEKVKEIENGVTTQQTIRSLFGSPWRTGIENGKTTWTYGMYRYQLFKTKNAKDLIIKFDNQNKVFSYTFSTTEHNE